MKKSLFFVALGALALTSCNQDEVKQVNQDAVTFSVVAENASRGTVITTESIDAFNVTAYLQEKYTGPEGEYTANGTVFMDDMTVSKAEDGTWTPAVTKFWPTSGTVNFYSYAPLSIQSGVKFDKTSQTIDYAVPTACEEQVDVLYALNTGLSKANKNVGVNFRHALSQVLFRAKCTKEDLKVYIQGVRVANVKNAGTLTMPTIATTFQYASDPVTSPSISWDTETNSPVEGEPVNRDTETDNTWGKWADNANTVLTSYAAAVSALSETAMTSSEVTLTANAQPLLLLPQQLAPAKVTDNYMSFKEQAFFAINCKIMSVEDGQEIQLWPAADDADGFAEVAIPVSSPDKVDNGDGTYTYFWKQGKKYVYTFVFGEGAGYIAPDTDDYEGTNTADPNEPGDPVLVPVTFTVTVDMFQTAREAVDMNTGNTVY